MCCITEIVHSNKSIPVSDMPTRIEALTLPLHHKAARAPMRRQQQQRAVRRVSFQPSEIDHDDNNVTRASSPALTTEERDELWYNPSEMNRFKNEARETSRRIRRNCISSNDECTRGLEQRISMDRQRNKWLAIRAILKAQDTCASPHELARIASRCTAWAKEVSLLTGHADYYAAYNPALVHLVPKTPSIPQPMDIHRKRPVQVIVIDDDDSEGEAQQRRIRPRLSIAQQTSPRRVGFVTAS